mmetsp:Transcript_2967/g.5495  ORF Transcript_2967/g.5495 Transcript_2967/m.5495 type:complete len:153 (-) Transcript_2967:1296-1754(-)
MGHNKLLQEDPEKWIKKVHEVMKRNDGFAVVYGLYQPSVLTQNLDFLKRVYSSEILFKSTRNFSKITIWRKLFGRGLFMIGDATAWKASQKICMRGMGTRYMKIYYKNVYETATRSVRKLEMKLKEQKDPVPLEVRKFFQDYTLDAIVSLQE